MKYNYTKYTDIPEYIRAYVLEVARCRNIQDIGLSKINAFMNSEIDFPNDPALTYKGHK
jgi:hypothetical protein